MDTSEGTVIGVFTCEQCDLSSPYTFYGQKPPNTRAIVLLEECYGMRDPFNPEREKFLVLGSKCCLCKKTVCVGTRGSCRQPYLPNVAYVCLNSGVQHLLHQTVLLAVCEGTPGAVSRADSNGACQEKNC
ncbi:cysteine-rich DPF motif domain-containing protein 1 isoform X2 [Electrophorus electricus]|uniref:cysteine-rich DPF motif domain-containing protein 1 isoform X2 n=1 Tax=Electrophorus electricus TaxID=8005 RepID=UPI000F0A0205|nr:cysteine-rich DPF motif domain-containing protein 1 isoform X2 [Electrophorus electricus]XP_026857983.1 cysteine-rich DPF motif domain-containing protein 1 isoform X2 [Electrophorus electricus]